jgi:hypothetical protein
VLTDVQGGAGLGTTHASVQIAPDGAPFGQFSLPNGPYVIQESDDLLVDIWRNYYSSGVVSVTLTPIAGTASAGIDFVADPVTVSWADGESGLQTVVIPIVDDAVTEASESFTLELSNPTGGAVIGPRAGTTVGIQASDQPVPAPPPARDSGGSGAFGLLSLLMLGAMSFLRAARKARPRTW